eukprot:3318611-Amphidinium_carterae.1
MQPSGPQTLVITECAWVPVGYEACALLDTPQKWIGSSVALGYDVAVLPSREEALMLRVCRCSIEVVSNALSVYLAGCAVLERDHKTKEDREKFWNYYTHGLSMSRTQLHPQKRRPRLPPAGCAGKSHAHTFISSATTVDGLMCGLPCCSAHT